MKYFLVLYKFRGQNRVLDYSDSIILFSTSIYYVKELFYKINSRDYYFIDGILDISYMEHCDDL